MPGSSECGQCIADRAEKALADRRAQEVKEGLQSRIDDLERQEDEILDKIIDETGTVLASMTPLPGDLACQPEYVLAYWEERLRAEGSDAARR